MTISKTSADFVSCPAYSKDLEWRKRTPHENFPEKKGKILPKTCDDAFLKVKWNELKVSWS